MTDILESHKLSAETPKEIDRLERDGEDPKFRADMLEGVQLLDSLICEFHDRIKKNIDKHFKTGDFIRMIELRYKLSPTTDEQRKFWEMLAKIRRATLQKIENEKRGESQKAGGDTPK